MSESRSTHESMAEQGPFVAEHQLLHVQTQECLMQLERTVRLLTHDVPPVLSAVASLPWFGVGASMFSDLLSLNESARSLLIDTAESSIGHYATAQAMLEATL